MSEVVTSSVLAEQVLLKILLPSRPKVLAITHANLGKVVTHEISEEEHGDGHQETADRYIWTQSRPDDGTLVQHLLEEAV